MISTISTDSKTSHNNTTSATTPTLNRLKQKKTGELLALFKTLDAPTFNEMDGEYHAELLDFGGLIPNIIGKLSTYEPVLNGKWLSKAFTPGTNNTSYGYNTFNKFGKIIRKYPMRTEIAPSRFDGKPVFQLTYSAYPTLLAKINMLDEIRKVEEGIYLGIGTVGFTKKQRKTPLPFCLIGPTLGFVGVD